jgi:cell wall assembly regulator SMI1
MLANYPAPAKPAAITGLEELIGHSLPDAFKTSYLIHDGGDLFGGESLMPLSRIERDWKMWASISEDQTTQDALSGEFTSVPAGAIKQMYANRHWIPFEGNQNFIAIDFDPGPQGSSGQIINAGRDDEVRHVVAKSFAGFMAIVAEQFAEDRIDGSSAEYLALRGTTACLISSIPRILSTSRNYD